MDIRTFCEQFYASHFIPIVCLSAADSFASFSAEDWEPTISAELLDSLRGPGKNPSAFVTSNAGMYGLVHVNATGEDIVIGPVFDSPVTNETAMGFVRYHSVTVPYWEGLIGYLSTIPQYTYNRFLNLLAFLHAALNGETLSILEHFYPDDETVPAKYVLDSANVFDEPAEHGTYQLEMQMLDLIRRGESDRLIGFLNKVAENPAIREGTLAGNPLRQAKNLMIGLAAEVGKFGAIAGGLDVEETYRLIDLYTIECENASTLEAVKALQYNMLVDFARRVENSQTPSNLSEEIAACVQYIRLHVNENILVDDIAALIGKSRAYTTKRFRQETGMTILAYITDCKLREAKSLLKYSSLSIADIGSVLGFSSQAYFQKVFKDHCGVTPMGFRESPDAGVLK